eukprot:765300-Hanusia_phi.AAC.2
MSSETYESSKPSIVDRSLKTLLSNVKNTGVVDESCPHQLLLEEFNQLDINGDLVVTPEELFEGFKHRMSEEELLEMFESIDTNKDGVISLDEYILAKFFASKSELEKCKEYLLSKTDMAEYVHRVAEVIRQDHKANPTAQIIDKSKKKQGMSNWKMLRKSFCKLTLDQFKERIHENICEVNDNNSAQSLNYSQAKQLLEKLGFPCSELRLATLFSSNGEVTQEVSEDKFVLFCLQLLAPKDPKKKTQRRLSQLAVPKRTSSETISVSQALGRLSSSEGLRRVSSTEDLIITSTEERRRRISDKDCSQEAFAKSDSHLTRKKSTMKKMQAAGAAGLQFEFQRLDTNGES